ncbi:MAG: hypothetical protein HYY84_03065 [Deltaproteobacteria bacterium]|nr:hypothetical protein [Deltaproteobacteria bacterium]
MRQPISKISRPSGAALVTLCVVVPLASCASAGGLRAELRPLSLVRAAPTRTLLRDNHFTRDTVGGISEENLKKILDAPVYLAEGARLGVVAVASGYEIKGEAPLVEIPAELSRALEDAGGLFKAATEVSTDWPADRGLGGLRELAARYRSEYLLLYRQRFVNRSLTNAWAWLTPTIIGALIAPTNTLEMAGVLEATLYDARTGSLLFTVFERVHRVTDVNIWNNDKKRRDMEASLLKGATKRLADQVVSKTRRLAGLRPKTPVAVPATADLSVPPRLD